MLKSKIRKGDTVMVISGRDAGKTGKVLSVDVGKSQVLVEKLNIVKRHTKPNQKNRQGGILEREAPLSIGKVMYYDANLNKPVRLGVKVLADGRRIRVSRPGGQAID
jgi:large subunit ribosomal protein L24